tara:strand:- start:3 stop:596 length:594 start_codon:yes stop_codon:yes gene_type:complete
MKPVSIGMLCLTILTAFVLATVLTQSLHREIHHRGDMLAESLADAIEEYSYQLDRQHIQSLIQHVLQIDDVQDIVVLDEHLRIQAHTYLNDIPNPILSRLTPMNMLDDLDDYDAIAPIKGGDRGVIWIQLDARQVEHPVRITILILCLVMLGFYGILFLMLKYYLSRSMEPLHHLKKIMSDSADATFIFNRAFSLLN